MPFTALDGFDLIDKLRVILEGNSYPSRFILVDCYYPIVTLPIPLPSREGRYKLDKGLYELIID
jgi:hypothetical protein